MQGVKKSSKNSLILSQQEMVLIKNSDEAKKTGIYGNLYSCLCRYPKLSKQDFRNDETFDKRAKATLLSSENKKLLIEKIMKEWYAKSEIETSCVEVKCQLCGQPNKYIFFICNKRTGVQLHVGSDCITRFPSIDGVQREKKKIDQLKKEDKQQARKIEFEILEEEEIDFLENSQRKFEDFPMLLPLDLYNDLKITLTQLKKEKNNYIKNGGKLEIIFKEYDFLRNRFNSLYSEAENYYNEVKANSLICNKETAAWLLKHNQRVWETVSRNGGLFSVETLKCLGQESFIKKRLNIFKKHLDDQEIQIIGVFDGKIRFSINSDRYTPHITFTMKTKKFMQNIGCYCLTKEDYKFGKEDLKDIVIENNTSNFDSLSKRLYRILNNYGYEIILENGTSHVYWVMLPYNKKGGGEYAAKREKLYMLTDIKQFLSTFSPFLLRDTTYIETHFEDIIKKMECGKFWISQAEKNENEEIAKGTRGLQRQKEFIPY